MSARHIFVTGGAGFIGSAVIRHLLATSNHSVTNIDKLTYAASLDSLRDCISNPNYQLEVADICDSSITDLLFQRYKPDAVLHLAAETHVDRSLDGPAPFITTNVVGTFTLAEAALRYWRGLTGSRRDDFRFVHISTDEVYGTLGPTGNFAESSAYAPNSPYSASKASSDFIVRAWQKSFGLPAIITHCSNNYGPYQFPEKLIPVVILAALEGRRIPVYGAGTNVRDWLFVEDHVRALATILEHGIPGETYNVGGQGEISNIDLVRLVCRLLDEALPKSPHRPHAGLIEFVADRPGHDFRYAIDAGKIERELGWRPSVGLEEGLRRTVSWYLDNRWWWEAIRARGHKQERLGLGTAQARQMTGLPDDT